MTLAFVPEGADDPEAADVGHARPAHRRPDTTGARRRAPRSSEPRRAGSSDRRRATPPPRRRPPDDGRPRERADDQRFVRAVVLVGGFGTRLRPLTLHHPEADAPDRPPADDRAGARPPGRPRRRPRRCCRSATGPTPSSRRFPDGPCAGVALHYAVEPEPLDTAGAIRFAALDAGDRRPFLVVNGDVLTDLDVGALVALPPTRPAPRARSHLTPVEDPSAFGVVPTDDDGRVRRVRREAAARRGAHQPDQRRHLRARAFGARPHRRVIAGCPSSGRPSRRWWTRAAVRARDGDATGSTPARRSNTSRRTSTCSAARALRVDGDQHPTPVIDETAVVERSLVGPGCRHRAAARRCTGSVLMASAVVGGAGPGPRLGHRAAVRPSVPARRSIASVVGDGVAVEARRAARRCPAPGARLDASARHGRCRVHRLEPRRSAPGRGSQRRRGRQPRHREAREPRRGTAERRTPSRSTTSTSEPQSSWPWPSARSPRSCSTSPRRPTSGCRLLIPRSTPR